MVADHQRLRPLDNFLQAFVRIVIGMPCGELLRGRGEFAITQHRPQTANDLFGLRRQGIYRGAQLGGCDGVERLLEENRDLQNRLAGHEHGGGRGVRCVKNRTSEEAAESSSTTVTATTAFVYDGDNNVTQSTNADGQIIVDVYNDLNQRTEQQWFASASAKTSDTVSNTITTSYDLSGDILNTADTYPSAYDTLDSEYTLTYNTLGQRITADNNGSGASGTSGTAGVPDVVLSSTYDALGDRTALNSTIASTADFQNSYTFDALGQESSVTQQGATGGNVVAYKVGYFDFTNDGQLNDYAGYGGPSNEDLSLYEYFDYNHDGSMMSTGSTGYSDTSGYGPRELESLSMSYDSDGRLTYVGNSVYSAEVQSYSYDHDSQLTYANGYGGYGSGLDLNYDANGNLAGSGTSVGDGNTQLQADGETDTFDAAGQVLTETDGSGNVLDLTWNIAGDMTSVTSKNSSGVTQYVITLNYDMFGSLIGRTYTPYSGGSPVFTQTQRFVIDPAIGNAVLEFNGGGYLTDRFLWGPLVDQFLADEKVSSLSSAGNVEWMATNNTGSVSDVFQNAYSVLIDHVFYNAYGAISSQTNSSSAPLFGYNGEFTDPITGLQYHNGPATGTGR